METLSYKSPLNLIYHHGRCRPTSARMPFPKAGLHGHIHEYEQKCKAKVLYLLPQNTTALIFSLFILWTEAYDENIVSSPTYISCSHYYHSVPFTCSNVVQKRNSIPKMELSWSASCYKQCHHLTAFPLQGAPRRASLFLTSLVHICHLPVRA